MTNDQKVPREISRGKNVPDPSACTGVCVCRCDTCVIFGAHMGQGHDDPRGRPSPGEWTDEQLRKQWDREQSDTGWETR